MSVKNSKNQAKGLDHAYEQVKVFHEAFNHTVTIVPTAIPTKVALARTVWTAEELVEFLYATADNDKKVFSELVKKLAISIFETERKILEKGAKVDNVLVGQMDALTDASYFIQGSHVVAGIRPQPLMDIVQEANMNKLWSDGRPRYRPEDGKIIKPDGWEAPEPKLQAEIERQIKTAEENVKNAK